MTEVAKGTALVTGASTGIGAVYADRLARRGHDLILVARDEARMAAIAARLRSETGRKVGVVAADLTKAEDVARIEAILADDARVDVLVNNAGMALHGGLLDNGPDAFTRIIALNVEAPTRFASVAAKAFVSRGRGAIVNVASVLAFAPERFDGVYSGTKAYLLNLSLSLAGQVKEKGVHVQAVLPGATRTEIWERAGIDLEGFPPEMVMEVGDLVDAALVGLDKGEVVTIPPLPDVAQYEAYEAARLAMGPNLSKREVAPRYRHTAATREPVAV